METPGVRPGGGSSTRAAEGGHGQLRPSGSLREFWGMGTVRASAQLLRRLRKDARGFKVSLGSLQNLSQNKL